MEDLPIVAYEISLSICSIFDMKMIHINLCIFLPAFQIKLKENP